jgi:hypothetical protein
MRQILVVLCALRSKLVFGIGCVALLTVILVPAITSQTEAATPPKYVRAACHDDARRLCAKVLSDTPKRQACMREHRAELSAGCKAAVAKWRGKEGGRPTSAPDDSGDD